MADKDVSLPGNHDGSIPRLELAQAGKSASSRVCFNFGNFHTGCVASVGVVPESVDDDVVYIRMESTLTTAYHTSPKPLRTISRTSVNVNMNPSSVSFFLPRENAVNLIAQI